MPTDAAAGAGGPILVIDDDPMFCKHVAKLLRDAGHEVVVAHDSYGALALSRDIRPAAVLIDVVLPDIEGPQLCRLLRQTAGYDSVPIVFITARESTQVLRDCLLAGGNDFLRKAHVEVELPLRLMSHLRIKVEHDRLRRRNQELDSLLYFARLLNRSLNVESVLQSMVEELSQTMGADRASVILWNKNTGKVLATAENTGAGLELDLGNYPEISCALATRQTVYVSDVREPNDHKLERLAVLDDLGIQSLLVVPLQTSGTMLGTLFLRTRRPNTIPREAVAFCQAAAEIACRSLVNARLFEHVRAERDELLLRGHPPSAMPEALNGVHLNLTAEALGIVTLISGYAELLQASRDEAGKPLDIRQTRTLALLCDQAGNLERLVRMLQLINGRHGAAAGNASDVVRQAADEVRPLLRNGALEIEVVCTSDFTVSDRERWRSFFVCLLRDIAQQKRHGNHLALHIDRPQIVLQPQTPSNEPILPAWALWRQIAELFGSELRASDNVYAPEVALVFDPT